MTRRGRMSMGLAALGAGVALSAAVAAQAQASAATGFSQPYMGTPRYEPLSATQAGRDLQVNVPLGQKRADRIARLIGLDKSKVFTRRQYALFIAGKGKGGNRTAAKTLDAAVRILTNTWGRPLYSNVDGARTPTVLASYGLMVNTQGMLQSPANASAPTRKANQYLTPGGYMGTWARANGAAGTMRMLYRSAYTREAAYGFKSQGISGAAQLVPNQKGTVQSTVGMSMAPSIWIANFALIYVLNPKIAAKMPAYWAPIPPAIASAIAASPTGQVPYSQYRDQLPTPG